VSYNNIKNRTLPKINPVFTEEVVKVAKRYTAADMKWVLAMSYTHPYGVYNNAAANIGNVHITKFNDQYEQIKEKYERNNKLFS